MKPLAIAALLFSSAIFFSTSPIFGQMPGQIVIPGPQPVGNAPFSAVEESEHVQTLADGTRVVSKTKYRLFRDSAGRTRREMYMLGHPSIPQDVPRMIVIQDPVAGVNYNLQPQPHVAHAVTTSPNLPILPPTKSSVSALPPQPKNVPEELRLKGTMEDLGTQIIEGVEAHGHRVTRTFPVGSQGNDHPIAIVEEVWNCPELDLVVLSKVSDPRLGDIVVRVVSLDRSEPDPALFQVPPDYTIVNQYGNPIHP